MVMALARAWGQVLHCHIAADAGFVGVGRCGFERSE
jgi:hypothetical protein